MTKKRSKNKQKKRSRKPSSHARSPQRATYAGLSIEIPPELRLLQSVDASGLRAIQKVNQLQGEIEQLHRDVASAQPVEVMPPEVTATLVSVATNAWRARNKMVDAETGEPQDDMRRVYRHIEGIFNAFEELGLRTIDPTGKAYDSGMALKVISFEPTPGLSSEEITETIKPSITWQGRLLQTGEVIVGTPIDERKQETEESHEQKHD